MLIKQSHTVPKLFTRCFEAISTFARLSSNYSSGRNVARVLLGGMIGIQIVLIFLTFLLIFVMSSLLFRETCPSPQLYVREAYIMVYCEILDVEPICKTD